METLIVGAGALGSYFGYKLALGGQKVTFFDTDAEKVALLNAQGLTIRELDGTDHPLPVTAVSFIEDAPAPELILVLVKAFSTGRAAREISLVLGEKTLVLTLQNGLGNVTQLAQYILRTQIFTGVTYQAAYELAPGHVQHNGNGLTILGSQQKTTLNSAMDLARLLNNCDLPAGATSDIDPIRWKKLLVNCAINPLSAISGLENGMLPKKPEIVRDMMKLVAEGVTVAQKVGVPLNYGEMWASVLDTCRSTAQNRSSMLADVQAGRMTEIEAINGSIVRLGEANGIDTPTHMRMVRKVVAIHGKKDSFRIE